MSHELQDTNKDYDLMAVDMEELNEIYGSDYDTPSENDIELMFVEDVRRSLQNESFTFDMDGWIIIQDVLQSVGRLKNADLEDYQRNGLNLDYDYILNHIGYSPRIGEAPQLYIERQGVLAAAIEGREWEDRLGVAYPSPSINGDVVDMNSIPFENMVGYRLHNGEPWTDADTDLLNSKIVSKWNQILGWYQSDLKRNQAMLDRYDAVAAKRREDGIMGNEPYLSAYESQIRLYGKSYPEVKDDYDKQINVIERIHAVESRNFFDRVYKAESTLLDGLPSKVRNGWPDKTSLVSKETLATLGPGYKAFQADRDMLYYNETKYALRPDATVDFSKHVMSSTILPDDDVLRIKAQKDVLAERYARQLSSISQFEDMLKPNALSFDDEADHFTLN